MARDYTSQSSPTAELDGAGLRIAVIWSKFNSEITSILRDGTVERLRELKVRKDDILVLEVPGAFELPLASERVIRTGKFDAVICIGCVIRGETSHYDFICDSIADAFQRVAVGHAVPVIAGVLTVENIEQARERSGGSHGNKGVSSADAAIKLCLDLKAAGV